MVYTNSMIGNWRIILLGEFGSKKECMRINFDLMEE